MIVESLLLNTLYKIQVVHSLPGRLRLHIPYIKKIPKEWHIEDNYFNIAQRICGIKKVDVCYQTANALVLYDKEVLSEDDVLKLFKDMASIGMRHRDEFLKYEPEEKREAVLHFVKIMDENFNLEPEYRCKQVNYEEV